MEGIGDYLQIVGKFLHGISLAADIHQRQSVAMCNAGFH
jgi:hypothetical protein